MNRNHVAQPNATATAWLGGRNYDWLSTAPPVTTSVAVRLPKRRRTNPQLTSPTSPHLPRRPSDPVAHHQPESSNPVHPERPPSAKRARTAPDPPRADAHFPQESPEQEKTQQTAPNLIELKQESSAACPASTGALADSTGRLPTPRNSMAPFAAEGPSPPPSRAPEDTTPNVPTPTSALPSPQAQPGCSPKYACFDRQACLDNVHLTFNTMTLTSATRMRCCSLQQAMKNNDHEYMLLHQFMSMAVAGQMPDIAPVIMEAMSHLASIATVAFGEPAAQSSLNNWFCDLPLPLKTLHERDRAHYVFHSTSLQRHSKKLVKGWKTFRDSKFPFTVPEFQTILGLHSPQWQRLANMAKLRLLMHALGIRIEVAKEHQFESRLMASFQAHQAHVLKSNGDSAESLKFREEAAELIEKMKRIPGPNQTPAINLDFHQPEQIPRHVHAEQLVRQQQIASRQHQQQSEQIARHRQWMQEQTGQRQATASQQHSERLSNPIAHSPANVQNTMAYNPVADPHNLYFNQNHTIGQPMSTPQDPRHQPHQFYQSPVQSPIPSNLIIQRHQPTPSQPTYHQHPSPVQTSRVHSPAQINRSIPQRGMQEQMGQYMTQEHQRRASGNGLPYGMAPQAQQQVQRQFQQQLSSSRREKLFQSVVDFAIPPKRLGGALGYDFEFEISPEDVANLPRKVGNVDEQTVVYRLRCIKVPGSDDLQKEWMSTPTTWPMCTLLTINGSHIRPQRKQDKWGAVLLSPFIKSSTNKLSIETIRGPEEPASSTFAVAVEKIKFQTGETISSLVTCPERVVSAASVLSSIRSAIDPKASDDKDSGDELAVTMSRITINLVDPQSASRICEIPVRSLACHHRDCFDLATFLASRPGIVTGVDEWRCPICRADARPAQLIVDGFLSDVRRQLESRGELDTAKAIIVEADGSWSVKEEARGLSEKRARSATAGTIIQNEASAPAPTSASASGDFFSFSTNETGQAAPAWFMTAGLEDAEVAEAIKTINSVGLVTQSNATSPAANAAASSARGSVNEPIIIDLSDDD